MVDPEPWHLRHRTGSALGRRMRQSQSQSHNFMNILLGSKEEIYKCRDNLTEERKIEVIILKWYHNLGV